MEPPENSGALFKNNNKKHSNHPDYTGKIKINGRVMKIAAWKNTISKGENSGEVYLSLKISEIKENKPKSSTYPRHDDL